MQVAAAPIGNRVPSQGASRKRPSAYLLLSSGAFATCSLVLFFATERLGSLALWSINVLLLVVGLHQVLSRRHPLFSLRNLFLFGFVVFQSQSAADALSLGYFGGVVISDVSAASRRFVVATVLFLLVFLTVYRMTLGTGGRIDARRLAGMSRGHVWRYLWQAGTLAVLSLTLVYGVPSFVPESVRNGLGIVTVALAAGAFGLVGWVWVHYPTHPSVVAASLAILAAASPAALADQFGRRPLLTMFGALLWSMYFSRWHSSRPRRGVAWIGVGSVVSLIGLAMFTSSRDPAEHNRSALEQLVAISEEGNVSEGLASLRNDEITGAMTLWALENLGERSGRVPLQSLRYIVELPVPRQLWSNKSVPLSKEFARLANVPGVAPERITIPAGILGSSWADGGWFALILYAGLLGGLLAWMDGFLFRNRLSPVVVVAFGAGFGQVVAFARGETSVFLVVFVCSITIAYIFLRVVGVHRTAALDA